jgi:hypothetical protein
MTIAVIGLMILGLAAAVAYPFFSEPVNAPAADRSDARAMLERDKAIAFMAIREAELDRAMGKLSDEDYATLRTQYEERAVHALAALDALPPEAGETDNERQQPGENARFCVGCGRGFVLDERFCPACGCARVSAE